jgi:pyrimidine operon attenuation protein/uracil phosphoribosyltransferase
MRPGGILPRDLSLLSPFRETDKGTSLPSDPSSTASLRDPETRPPASGLRCVLDDRAIRRALMRIAHEIGERNEDVAKLYLVAIPNGGVPLARQLARNLREVTELDVVIGILDTTLYRDDLITNAERPALRRTEMPSAVDDHVVVLVDDVASTRRTIRAAMDALMDFGRPQVVQVMALVDRGHRELPISLDYVGKNIPTQVGDHVRLQGADGGSLDGLLEVVVVGDKGEGES